MLVSDFLAFKIFIIIEAVFLRQMQYLVLQHPGHNRVYYNSADKLALAELEIACSKFSVSCKEIKVVEIENIRYLSFETKELLSENDFQILSRLSFVFAIYSLEELNDKTCLIPARKTDYKYLDEKIGTLFKYQGKTNELFTKMMINVGLLSSEFDYTDHISLLDPVAGKGTTLFEGAIYGFNVFGIEIEAKFVHETSVYFKKYLEAERLKHKIEKKQVSGSGKSNAIMMQKFDYARSKQEFKQKDLVKELGLICGNSQDAVKYFKHERFHLIVGDLPYGIVHGNSGAKKTTAGTRNPSELLNDCLPGWNKVLKTGGVIVVAWNAFVVSKQKLIDIFKGNGFDVLSDRPYDSFEHIVDKSIKRDIIVARKV